MGKREREADGPTAANAPTEPAAEWVAIESLSPWAENPRRNDAAVARVAASIKRFGFGAPIVARRADGEVIAGHTRLKAAQSLGLKSVPVRFLDLDPADAHLLALADNKIGEIAEWDPLALAEELSKFSLTDADLAGWSSEELDKLAGSLPDFEPNGADDQPSLDVPGGRVTCPKCGHEFQG